MSRDDILNMPVGRELDALIGKKFSGWWEPIDGLEYLPLYTREISEAWRVEEKMNTDELFWRYANEVKKLILAEKGECNEFDMMHASPEVRCKAALLAVME